MARASGPHLSHSGFLGRGLVQQARLPQNSTPNSSISDILWAFVVVSFPLSLLSVALCALVFSFRVNPSPPSELYPHSTGIDPDAFYVTLSATSVALVASFSSTVATFLVNSAMTLVIYSISSAIVRQSAEKQLKSLPTPFQLGLMINLRNGSLSSLWPCMKYYFSWKGRRRVAHCLRVVIAATLFAALLSYASYP